MPAAFFVPPFFFYFLLALCAPFLVRSRVPALYPLLGCLVALVGSPATFTLWDSFPFDNLSWDASIGGLSLHLFAATRVGLAFAWGFSFVSLLIFLYGGRRRDALSATCVPIYIGSGLGAVLAGDLLTFFIFLEVMTVASALLLFSRRGYAPISKALSYLYFHLFAGVCMLIGIICSQQDNNPSLLLLPLTAGGMPWLFVSLALVIKMALVPTHSWLVDSYDEADDVGTMALTIFTTKSALFGAIVLLGPSQVLVVLGLLTMAFSLLRSFPRMHITLRSGALCFLNAQLGFMAVGVGSGLGDLTALYAFNHIVYDGVLFTVMGYCLRRWGSTHPAEIPGGLFAKTPLLLLAMIVALFNMLGLFPTTGFLTEGLLSEAVGHAHASLWVKGVMSGCVALMTAACLLFVERLFFAPNEPKGTQDKVESQSDGLPLVVVVSLLLGIAACMLPLLYAPVLDAVSPAPVRLLLTSFSWQSHLSLQAGLLLLGVLMYVFVRKHEWPRSPLLAWSGSGVYATIAAQIVFESLALITFLRMLTELFGVFVRRTLRFLRQPELRFAVMEWQGIASPIRVTFLFLLLCLLVCVLVP